MKNHFPDTAEKLGILKFSIPEAEISAINVVKSTHIHKPFPKIKGYSVHLDMKENAKPVHLPPRHVPGALNDKIREKIEELQQMHIIEMVHEPSKWLSALVPIIKNDGDVRLCVDLRRLNKEMERERHPLPTFEKIMPLLRNAKVFSLLDIKCAFHQCELDPESRPLTTFWTEWGIYRYRRLAFGICSAPEKFQKIMERILAGCQNVVVYIDDILVYGDDFLQHDKCLSVVLKRLEDHDILLNHQKCTIKAETLTFLGHILSKEGIRPMDEKITAVLEFRAPQTKGEMRSFLGLACYLCKFIPDFATRTHPLRELLKEGTVFEWNEVRQTAFDDIKAAMANTTTLGFYDARDKTVLIVDASPYGLGAVLTQLKTEGPRVIAYGSKSLTQAESRYCQSEREALALVWAVEHFSYYLLGIDFDLITDHKSLETLFGTRSTPCPRIERWVLRLQAYRYQIKFKSGKTNLADPLSRLLTCAPIPFDEETEIFINAIKMSAAVDIAEVEQATNDDETCQMLREAIESGNYNESQLKEYSLLKDQLSFIDGLIVKRDKIIIPKALRGRYLELSHEGHPGETLMKKRLRSKCWWPQLDKDVANFVKKCESCWLVSAPNKPESMSRRELPMSPWTDIAIDYLGPLPTGEFLLVVIDYFSRYMEVKPMSTITAEATINKLDEIFIRLGFPRTITLDNGRQFVSSKFHEYCQIHAIHLNHVAPYWPQSNGLVERQNRSLLKRLRIGHAERGNWKPELRDYLLMYNSTPHTTTNKTPTEMMFGWTIRSKLPQLMDIETAPGRDDIAERDAQLKEKGRDLEDKKRGAKPCHIDVGDTVLKKNMVKQDKLTTTFDKQRYQVVKRNGTKVTIQDETGDKYERNLAHIKKVLPEYDSSDEEPFKGFPESEN